MLEITANEDVGFRQEDTSAGLSVAGQLQKFIDTSNSKLKSLTFKSHTIHVIFL